MGYEVKMMVGTLTEQESLHEKNDRWFQIYGIMELPKFGFIGDSKFEKYHGERLEFLNKGPSDLINKAFVYQIFRCGSERESDREVYKDSYDDPLVIMDPKMALKFLEEDYLVSKAKFGRDFKYEAAISMIRTALETNKNPRLRVVCYGH